MNTVFFLSLFSAAALAAPAAEHAASDASAKGATVASAGADGRIIYRDAVGLGEGSQLSVQLPASGDVRPQSKHVLLQHEKDADPKVTLAFLPESLYKNPEGKAAMKLDVWESVSRSEGFTVEKLREVVGKIPHLAGMMGSLKDNNRGAVLALLRGEEAVLTKLLAAEIEKRRFSVKGDFAAIFTAVGAHGKKDFSVELEENGVRITMKDAKGGQMRSPLLARDSVVAGGKAPPPAAKPAALPASHAKKSDVPAVPAADAARSKAASPPAPPSPPPAARKAVRPEDEPTSADIADYRSMVKEFGYGGKNVSDAKLREYHVWMKEIRRENPHMIYGKDTTFNRWLNQHFGPPD